MRKLCPQLTMSLALLGLGPIAAHAEEWLAKVATVELHRFQVPGPQIGYFLTLDKQEGSNLGYTYEGQLFPGIGLTNLPGALIPTPVQDQTIAIHRYKVTMPSGVTSYYYTTDSSISRPDYEYQKLVGYAYKVEETNFFIHEYYSPERGFWYNGIDLCREPPPGPDFQYRGTPFGLFEGPAPTEVGIAECPNEEDRDRCRLRWDPIACRCGLPADPCNIYYQNACYSRGGNWAWPGCQCVE